MAHIGMRTPKFWPITTRTDGSAITYGSPVVIGKGVNAQVTFDTADNPDYGDDVIVDNDKGVNGYNITLETNDMSKESRAAVLGWKPVTTGTTTPVITKYKITGEEPPEGGFSFIRVKKSSGVVSYEAFFFHALQFSDGGENASTKQKQIQWNHQTVNGTGIGVYLDSTGEVQYFDYMEFATLTAAETWINGEANYTPPANNG